MSMRGPDAFFCFATRTHVDAYFKRVRLIVVYYLLRASRDGFKRTASVMAMGGTYTVGGQQYTIQGSNGSAKVYYDPANPADGSLVSVNQGLLVAACVLAFAAFLAWRTWQVWKSDQLAYSSLVM